MTLIYRRYDLLGWRYRVKWICLTVKSFQRDMRGTIKLYFFHIWDQNNYFLQILNLFLIPK